MKNNMESPKLNMDEAQEVAKKMQEKIKSEDASNFPEAEKIVENEAKVKNIQKALMHPTYIGRRDDEGCHSGSDGIKAEAKNPGKLMGLYVDYEYIYRAKEAIDRGANILLVGGEIYSSVGSDYFPDGKKPTYDETQSDPGKDKLVYEAFDKKLSNAIRIEPTEKKEDCVSEDVENKIKEYLVDGKSILDVLKDLEKQNIIKIGLHFNSFYIINTFIINFI